MKNNVSIYKAFSSIGEDKNFGLAGMVGGLAGAAGLAGGIYAAYKNKDKIKGAIQNWLGNKPQPPPKQGLVSRAIGALGNTKMGVRAQQWLDRRAANKQIRTIRNQRALAVSQRINNRRVAREEEKLNKSLANINKFAEIIDMDFG